MANLSQNDRIIIAEHPLDKCLDHLRDPLRRAEQRYEPNSLSHHDVVNGADSDPQKAILRLLTTLMSHEVALDLRSKTGSGDIASDLFGLRRRVRNGNFNYEHHRALSRLVVKQASDVDVWNAVFDLITTVSRTTPPTSIPVSFDGTPITSSSASQQGGEQT